jgi:hypothetical protein
MTTRSLLRSPLLAVAALVVGAAMPAVASATVTGVVSQTCYSHVPGRGSQPIIVALTGGTPNAQFILSATAPGKDLASAGSFGGQFDATGSATAELDDVFPPSGAITPLKGQTLNLSVADYGVDPTGKTETPIGKTLITNLAIDVSTKPSNPRRARRVTVSGTPFAGKKLYGFITKRGSKHVLRRFKLGTANVCGYASSKQIVAPPKFKNGHYALYVNAGSKLRPSKSLAYGFRIFTTSF